MQKFLEKVEKCRGGNCVVFDPRSKGMTSIPAEVLEMPGLAGLSLTGTDVTDFAPLSGMVWLESLNLSRTGFSDTALLSGLTGLRELKMERSAVSDLAPLAALTGVRELDLSGAPVAQIAALEERGVNVR